MGHATGEPRRPAVWRYLVALLLPAVVGLACWHFLRSSFYGDAVCVRCGAEQVVEQRALASITYYRRVTLQETPISRVLNPGLKQACPHDWYELHHGATSSLLHGGDHRDGWSRSWMVRSMAQNESFAHELAQAPRPQEVWQTICRAARPSPEATDRVLSRPVMAIFAGRPSAQWWNACEADLRRLSGSPRPRAKRSPAP